MCDRKQQQQIQFAQHSQLCSQSEDFFGLSKKKETIFAFSFIFHSKARIKLECLRAKLYQELATVSSVFEL